MNNFRVAPGKPALIPNAKKARLSLDILKPMQPEQKPDHITDARHKFAKKRFDREYRCEPSPEVEAAIFKAKYLYRTHTTPSSENPYDIPTSPPPINTSELARIPLSVLVLTHKWQSTILARGKIKFLSLHF
jgi:hypothetical protein